MYFSGMKCLMRIFLLNSSAEGMKTSTLACMFFIIQSRDGSIGSHRFLLIRHLFFSARSRYSIIEPVLRINESNSRVIRDCEPETDSLLICPEIYSALKKKLVNMYGEYPERLAFLREEDQEDFFLSLGLEWIRYPYSFSVVTFI